MEKRTKFDGKQKDDVQHGKRKRRRRSDVLATGIDSGNEETTTETDEIVIKEENCISGENSPNEYRDYQASASEENWPKEQLIDADDCSTSGTAISTPTPAAAGNAAKSLKTLKTAKGKYKDMDKLLMLLIEMDMPNVYEVLKSCGFNINNLRYINDYDLERIFPERKNIALRAELREKILLWKMKNSPEETVSWKSKVLSWMNTNNSSSSTDRSKKINVCNVNDILKASPTGKSVLAFYARNNRLDQAHRKKLLNCVASFYFDSAKYHKIPRPEQIQEIASQISALFPTESEDIYYISRKQGKKRNPSGLLYNKFNNLKRKKRSVSDGPTSTIMETAHTYTAVEKLVKNPPTAEVVSMKYQLINIALDYKESMRFWAETFTMRNDELKVADLNTILREWPCFKKPGGEKFINYDFDINFPGKKNSLFNQWTDLEKRLTSFYVKHLKDLRYIELFKSTSQLSINSDSKACIITMLINAILKPTSKYATKDACGKITYQKSTIADAIDSSIVHIATIDELEHVREKKIEKAKLNHQKVQPFVIAVGPSLCNLYEFYLSFNSSFLRQTDFITALDTCFKIFHVFHLEYPKVSCLFWLFLQRDIYQIKTKFDIKSSAVTEFIENIRL